MFRASQWESIGASIVSASEKEEEREGEKESAVFRVTFVEGLRVAVGPYRET